MKTEIRTAVTVMALLAMPAMVAAQAPTHDHQNPSHGAAWSGVRGMPLQALLQHRAELGLSADQITRLETIQARVQEQNQPLMAQLRELGMAQRPDGAAAPRDRGARAGARGALTPEQREEMRARMQERRAQITPEQREEMRARMQERRGQMTPERRERMAARMQERVPAEARPILEQLRENTSTAMAEAREVLTDQQEAQIRELMRTHAAERRGMPFRGGSRGSR